jgi:outer membrane protein TolC
VQSRLVSLASAAALLLLCCGTAMAGEYTSIEIGHTNQHLRDSAPGQPKHYIGYGGALDKRLCRLMDDVDHLLLKLHAMPAQTSGTAPVVCPIDKELGRLFDIALRTNPELDVPRSELAVLAARTRQAGAPLDPMLSFELMDLPALNPVRPGDITGTGMSVGIEQEFQSYGKRGLRRRIASKDEALKELELAQKETDLMMEVAEAYYTLFGLVAKKRAVEQNLELMRIIVEMGERKLAIGTEPQAAVLSAQVQASRMELMLTELNAQIDQGYIALAEKLGFPKQFNLKEELQFDAAYPLPPEVEWDNSKLIPESLARWPEYQRQCLMQQQEDLMVEMARRDYFPDYTLMGKYEAAFGMEDSYSFEVRVPLFLHKEERQDAAYQEQYAQKAVIENEAQAVAAKYISRLENLEVELRMHGQLVDLLRSGTVPQARLALESNIAGFGANMMDFSDLIMAQQTLLDQEQELEQNYIHILHTLTDLHVLTLGAFDPAPYYVPTERPTVAAASPIAGNARGTSLGISVGSALSQRAIQMAGKYRPLLGIPDGFIEDLGLPQAEIAPKAEEKQPRRKAGRKDDQDNVLYKPVGPKAKGAK